MTRRPRLFLFTRTAAIEMARRHNLRRQFLLKLRKQYRALREAPRG